MDLVKPSPQHAELALRAMKTIATCDGTEPLSTYHRAVFAALQRHVFESSIEIDTLQGIAPAALAAALPSPELREIAVRELAYLALVDPDVVGEDRTALVDAFAAALGVAPDVLSAMHHAARRQTMRLQIDALRIVASMFSPETLGERVHLMWQAIAPFLGVTDGRMAARYQALEALPSGTLGREYHDFIRSRNLAFPGEKGGAPEMYFVAHDMTHILGEYSTEPEGEVQIIGFEAGYRRRGGLDVILLALCQAQLGIVLDPVAPARVGSIDFDALLAAFRRGCAVGIDFSDRWDYWGVIDVDVVELRRRYGVPPRA